MNGNEMRLLLKKICALASRKAHDAGYDIDFEHSLYIEAGNNIWTFRVARQRIELLSIDKMTPICLGVHFMRIVPAIDRFDYDDRKHMMLSPIAKMSLKEYDEHINPKPGHASSWALPSIRLPVVDEFAYKFSNQALEMILHALIAHGIRIEMPSHTEKDAEELSSKINKKFKEDMKRLDFKLASDSPNSKLKAKYLQIYNEYDQQMTKVYDLKRPIVVEVIPACKTFEELAVVLDMNDI